MLWKVGVAEPPSRYASSKISAIFRVQDAIVPAKAMLLGMFSCLGVLDGPLPGPDLEQRRRGATRLFSESGRIRYAGHAKSTKG